MKKLLGTALAIGATMAGATALAQSANAAIAYNIGVSTDYVFRGIDQFAGTKQAEGFGGADWTSSNSHFYLGTWISNTNTEGCSTAICGFNTENVEVDLYGGWKPVVGPFTLDLGAITYLYTNVEGYTGGGPRASGASNFELKAGASVPIGGFTAAAKFYWTPHYLGTIPFEDNDGEYVEGDLSYTFKNKATVSGAIGHQWASNLSTTSSTDEYTTYNIGVTYPITDRLSIDGRLYQSSFADNNGLGSFAFTSDIGAEDTKAVGTLTVSF